MTLRRVPRRRSGLAATAVAVVLLATGCSGDDTDSGPRPEPQADPSEAPTLTVEPVVSSGEIVGHLPRKDRKRVDRAVSGIAVRWLDAAYLDGRYPRQRFRNSFGMFTAAARAAARHDLDRMTNAGIGRRIDGVTPYRVNVRVDLLSPKGRALTGTAHVDARFRTSGDLERSYRITGRLMMTRWHGRWRVFAYDVARVRVDGQTKRHQRAQRHQKQDKQHHKKHHKQHHTKHKHAKNGDRA